IVEALDAVMRRGIPTWLELERDAFKGTVKTAPVRADITSPAVEEQLIVELYSK
ncbi:MAG: 30S ribosomal protein S4, partial [Desulfuromonas sp.]|nr:30S ribosomal protein S4 [Desulfuromonas sp.]